MVIIFEISGVGLTLCNLVKDVQRNVFEMNALFYAIMDCKQRAEIKWLDCSITRPYISLQQPPRAFTKIASNVSKGH